MSDSSPLIAQYRSIKANYPDCVLFFRVGDFYETFDEDAVDVARILNIALTTRDKKKPNPIPLAGVPFHAAETYIGRLLTAGKKVAVCEQVEDAAQAKGLVRREVVEVLTPGTSMHSQMLDTTENNFCLALCAHEDKVGLALIDVSTGELLCGEHGVEAVQHLVQGKPIREAICRSGSDHDLFKPLLELLEIPYVAALEPERFETASVDAALSLQFGGSQPPAMGDAERAAVGAVLAHCHELRGGRLPHVVDVDRLAGVEFLALDDETIRNLELFEPFHGGDKKATLVRTIDRTLTSMGARELRTWLQKPLARAAMIESRLDAVGELYGTPVLHEGVAAVLKHVHDMPRLAARIAAQKAIPRELHGLRESIERLPELSDKLSNCHSDLLKTLDQQLAACTDLADLAVTIEGAIVEEPPGHLRDGGVIRKGFSDDLDTLIDGNEAAKSWIASLEQRERERTGIAGLKVGFNKVFGYFIEVTKAHVAKVPEDYIAKQTLVNAERYYTKDLKEREQQILESEEKRVQKEQEAFRSLCERVAAHIPAIQRAARAVAQIDVLQSLAATARQNRYRRPVVDETTSVELVASRHPVLEQIGKEKFVPNDLDIDRDKKQFALITGPNMSGKSTYLRQVALNVILAQMGSFVPADRAKIGIVDKVFTRVGAGDRLSRGESTFLVEMKETANILERMTDRSLVLLDEVGRGTSTYDGLSIAWAVTEYLLQGVHARPKVLFATHFHELTQLRSAYPRLVNLKITIREWEGGIIFLRKIAAGTSDRSYGIHAAKIAGVPGPVLKRAEDILKTLELRRDLLNQGVEIDGGRTAQFSLFDPAPSNAAAGAAADTSWVADEVADFAVESSTPLEALQFLESLQKRLKD